MRFEIAFAHNQHPVFVAQLVEVTAVGIVARSYCGNVVFPKQNYIRFVELPSDVSAVFRVEFVSVDSAEFQGFSVQQNKGTAFCIGIVSFDFDGSESEHKFPSVAHYRIVLAVFVQNVVDFVKIGIFAFP